MALLLGAAIAGCGQNKHAYFPLDSGFIWTYRQTVLTRNKGNAGAFEKYTYAVAVSNLPAEMIGTQRVFPRLYADGGKLYFVRDDSDGIALVASRTPGGEPLQQIEPRYVIKLPLAINDSWTEPGETQILRWTFLGGYGQITKSITADGPLTYKVESLDDTVHVPAGTFRHCLRLHGIGAARLPWGEPYDVLTATLDTVEWYAPSVGLVKRLRQEQTGPDGPLGAELDEELQSVERPGWFG